MVQRIRPNGAGRSHLPGFRITTSVLLAPLARIRARDYCSSVAHGPRSRRMLRQVRDAGLRSNNVHAPNVPTGVNWVFTMEFGAVPP